MKTATINHENLFNSGFDPIKVSGIISDFYKLKSIKNSAGLLTSYIDIDWDYFYEMNDITAQQLDNWLEGKFGFDIEDTIEELKEIYEFLY